MERGQFPIVSRVWRRRRAGYRQGPITMRPLSCRPQIDIMKQYRRIFRIISRIAAGLAVISWFGLGEHQGNYVTNRPREPEPSLGFTVPYETKGTIVCVSNADRELDNGFGSRSLVLLASQWAAGPCRVNCGKCSTQTAHQTRRQKGPPQNSKGTTRHGKGPVPVPGKEHIANREQSMYTAPLTPESPPDPQSRLRIPTR